MKMKCPVVLVRKKLDRKPLQRFALRSVSDPVREPSSNKYPSTTGPTSNRNIVSQDGGSTCRNQVSFEQLVLYKVMVINVFSVVRRHLSGQSLFQLRLATRQNPTEHQE